MCKLPSFVYTEMYPWCHKMSYDISRFVTPNGNLLIILEQSVELLSRILLFIRLYSAYILTLQSVTNPYVNIAR